MAAVKTNLKLARDLLGKKDYKGASEAANLVLQYDPSNYNGLVFLGLASLELGDLKKSEETYRTAIQSNENQPLAWQGIAKLYERAQRWQEYGETLLKLADIFSESGDAVKCAETLSKYIELQREQGSRRDVVQALSLLLESSPYYRALSALSEPDASAPTASPAYSVQVAIYNNLPTLQEIITITEDLERDTINQEIQKRRTRIDAPPLDRLKQLVKREVWSASKLEALYTEVLNHPGTSDDLRRSIEASLLERKRDRLWALPPEDIEKEALRREVQEMVDGMVLLRIPNELAWAIYFETLDHEDLRDYKLNDIRNLIDVLPATPLARVWKSWMLFHHIPAEEDEEEAPSSGIDPEEALEMALELLSTLPESHLLRRILASFYWSLRDFENAIKLAEGALRALSILEASFGQKLPKNGKSLNVILSCSFVHHYPPKYHARALRTLDAIIEEDPKQAECRLARGYIHEQAERWNEAKADFDAAISVIEAGSLQFLEASEESSWCHVQSGSREEGIEGLQQVAQLLETYPDQETAPARVWWRLGKANWDVNDSSTYLPAYRLWISALKTSTSFAPAYTSLGIYYSDYADPADPVRASKCFQKAFELDPREAEAARRLAEGFVEEREWELAEIVARRTIEGEGGTTDTGAESLDSRHKPMNVWAWKVVGLVSFYDSKYPQAIEAFQVALRTQPDDGITWLRLGEAYAAAGRYTAALRAMERARQLRPDDYQCIFQIAEVTRELGDYHTAIELYDSILEANPKDAVAHFSRCSTRLSLSRHERNKGFLERGFYSCVRSIEESIETLVLEGAGPRVLWKVISDALFELWKWPVDGEDAESAARFALEGVTTELAKHAAQIDERVLSALGMSSISSTGVFNDSNSTWELIGAKVASIAACYCISLAGNDEVAQGASYYDTAMRLLEFTTSYSDHIKPEDITSILQLAIEYSKRAIRHQSNEPQYWNILGVLTLESNPKLSQHAFIRALQCEPKSPLLWTNLGLLYTKHDDLQLAQDAFHRAQILDPDYALSWVGQAIVAGRKGDSRTEVGLLEHATTLSADMPIPNLEFAYQAFKSHRSNQQRNQVDSTIAAFFALERTLQRQPKDVNALHLAALISEQLGLLVRATTFSRRSSALLEASYERFEDPKTARQYAITQSTLGRILLADGNFIDAIKTFETVLSLVDREDEQTESNAEAASLRTQAHLGVGLASMLLGEAETAVSSLEAGLEEAPQFLTPIRTQLTVLLAQTMWMLGTTDSREMAKSVLLESIESDPKNLGATVVLGAIATLLDEEGLLEAALSEIIALPAEERRQLDHLRQVDALLLRHHLIQGSLEEALKVAQQALESDPSNEVSKLNVSELLIRQSSPAVVLDILKAESIDMSNLSAQLRLSAIASSSLHDADGKAKASMESAVHLAPWDAKNWLGLAQTRAQEAASN